MQIKKRLEKFLKAIQKEEYKHRQVAHELNQEARHEKNILDDTKYHDGQSDMACKLEVKFRADFSEELKR